MLAARILGTAALALGLVFTAPAHAQEKAKGKSAERAPLTKVILENDKVRVTRTTFRPGDVSRADRRDRTVYVIKGSKMQRTTPEGKTTQYERKSGEANWLAADKDVVKNIGKGNFELVTVVNK